MLPRLAKDFYIQRIRISERGDNQEKRKGIYEGTELQKRERGETKARNETLRKNQELMKKKKTERK